MEIGIIAALIIGFSAIYLDLKNKVKEREEKIRTWTQTLAIERRRLQVMESHIEKDVLSDVEEHLLHDPVTKLLRMTPENALIELREMESDEDFNKSEFAEIKKDYLNTKNTSGVGYY